MDQPNEPKITVVTRNEKPLSAIIAEFVVTAFAFYYITHPTMFDDVKRFLVKRVYRLAHKISVWRAQSAIQSLPETDRACGDDTPTT